MLARTAAREDRADDSGAGGDGAAAQGKPRAANGARPLKKPSGARRLLVDKKLQCSYRCVARGERPSAFWCAVEPVKKHGPGKVCALANGDAVRRSRLGNCSIA